MAQSKFPGAIQKRLSKRFSGKKKLVAFNRVTAHVAVSLASSLHGYFNAPYRPSSTYYVRMSGVAEQYVDLFYQAEADGEGNDATWSIETQGGLRNANTEKWTRAQMVTIAKIFAFHVREFDVRNKLASSSKLGEESKGLAWHRLGIDGNFPSSGILAGRSQRGGGMRWSSSFGKICPGDAKIEQIPEIHKMAQDYIDGPDRVDPPKKPNPKPTRKRKTKPRYPVTIRNKSRGPLRKLWQRILLVDGYDLGRWGADGVYGDTSERATKQWQRDRGLTPDGVVGPATWTRALMSDDDGRLRYGDRGPHVRLLQHIIRAEEDDVFGKETRTKTKRVQRYLKVKADAIPGPNTVDALVDFWS